MERRMFCHFTLILFVTLESLVLSRPSPHFTPSTMNRNAIELDWIDGRLNISMKRKIRLYSAKSKRYLQVQHKIVDGKADHSSGYARLELESVGYGWVRIKGNVAQRYVCFNPKTSKLITKKNGDNVMCVFREIYNADSFKMYFQSFSQPNWYIAVKNNGNMRSGLAGEEKDISDVKNSTMEFIEKKWTNVTSD